MSHQESVSNHVISDAVDASAAVSQKSSAHSQYLERILKTQDNMRRIREGFAGVLAGCNYNQSLLSKAAVFWADVSLRYKIGLGVLFIAPLFVLGVLANLSVLLTLCVVAVVVYAASSLLLDNHQYNTSLNQAKLNSVASNMLEFFEDTTGMLHDLSKQISLALDALTQENAVLALRVIDLGRHIEDLSTHNESLLETSTALSEEKEKLMKINEQLDGDIKLHSALFDTMQSEMQTLLSLYTEAKDSLSCMTSELFEVKVTLGAEIESMQNTTTKLKSMVKNMSEALLKKNAGQMKLDGALSDCLSGLTSVAQGLEGSCAHFEESVEETKALHARHSALLDRKERQVIQLEQLVIQAQSEGSASSAIPPNPYGLFSKPSVLETRPKSAVCIHYPVLLM